LTTVEKKIIFALLKVVQQQLVGEVGTFTFSSVTFLQDVHLYQNHYIRLIFRRIIQWLENRANEALAK